MIQERIENAQRRQLKGIYTRDHYKTKRGHRCGYDACLPLESNASTSLSKYGLQADRVRQAQEDLDMKEATFRPQINPRRPGKMQHTIEVETPPPEYSPRVKFDRHKVESVQSARDERGCMHGESPIVADNVRTVEWTLHCDPVYLRQTNSEQPSPGYDDFTSVYDDFNPIDGIYSPEVTAYGTDPSPEVGRIETESLSLETEVRQMMSEWKQFELYDIDACN